MKKEKLIEELQKLPKGIEVCVFDWRKNLHNDIGDGSSEGIYSDFEIETHDLPTDEAEYYEEHNGKKFVPFASLTIGNNDYDDYGESVNE